MKKLWDKFFGPEREARRLRRDADYVLGALDKGHYGPVEDHVASDLAKDLAYARATFLDLEHGHARAEDHFKRMHRECRRRASQRDLTSLTLAIIYVRADKLGGAAKDVTEKIDAFLAKWAHLTDDGNDGSATGAARFSGFPGDGGAG